MPRTQIDDRSVSYLAFVNAERGKRHHTQNEDMLQYDLLRAGDMRSVEECRRMLDSDLPGHVSDDPLRNQKYLFVASIALVSRYCIEEGMDPETAYSGAPAAVAPTAGGRTAAATGDGEARLRPPD